LLRGTVILNVNVRPYVVKPPSLKGRGFRLIVDFSIGAGD
jgi:hypothetical protein